MLSLHKANNSLGWIAKALNRSHGAIKSRLAKHYFHVEQGKRCGAVDERAEKFERLAHEVANGNFNQAAVTALAKELIQ